MERYEINIEDINFNGVDAISLVEFPAIEMDFIALSEEKLTFAKTEVEKRIITGPALIPNKDILRKGEDEKYYNIFFSENTIEKASQLFLMKKHNDNVTLEHTFDVNNIYTVESWIVLNSDNDKSKELGFDVPVGTWMLSLKVENDGVWNNLIKTGDVKGFSIEGYFTQKLVELSTIKEVIEDEEIDDEIILSEIRKLLNL